MNRIVFSHGNSFPSGTYSALFEHLRAALRSARWTASATTRRFPVTDNWPHLVEQLAGFAARRVRTSGGPVYLVGHSLGGILPASWPPPPPELARGVLMLDSPLLGGWRATTVGAAKRTQVIGAISPARVSRMRLQQLAQHRRAYERFRKEKAFDPLGPTGAARLRDHGLYDEDDRRVLAFDRAVEAPSTAPCPTTGRLLRKRPRAARRPSSADVPRWKCVRPAWA